ncbi:MAG TPA: phosphoribosylformylglycinamidine synthase I [Patescibacteria group bacterium]
MAVEILKAPRAVVLKASGINCDEETSYAFDLAGAESHIVHINQIKSGEYKIGDYQIVVIPGGFSYGDDIASGRIMAIELQTFLADELMEHKEKGKLILGICNGFQVLVQSGLLPFGEITSLSGTNASLEANSSGHFESRWVYVKQDEGAPFSLPVAHGEGRFVSNKETLSEIEENGQVILRYCTCSGDVSMEYPYNPNGSMNAIAGICDQSGLVIGLMPHPERAVQKFQSDRQAGLSFLKDIVNLAKGL